MYYLHWFWPRIVFCCGAFFMPCAMLELPLSLTKRAI
nr:MAG TPA: hypothetical protein [Caudoviricetes sp.]